LPQDAASFGGYYASDTKLGQVVFDADKNALPYTVSKNRRKHRQSHSSIMMAIITTPKATVSILPTRAERAIS